MADTEVKTKDETVEQGATAPAADAPVDAPEAAASDSENAKTRLEAVPEETKSRRGLIIKLGGALTFLVIVGGSMLLLQDGIVAEPKTGPAIDQTTGPAIDPSLTARELLNFGRQALNNSDARSALRMVEEARFRANLESPDDVNLLIDVFRLLADIELVRGRKKVARMHLDYVQAKQAELGDSLPLFNKAEELFRAGKQVEARKYYARFLLLEGNLTESGKRYLETARRRIADSYELEFKNRYAPPQPQSLVNPEEFFRDK